VLIHYGNVLFEATMCAFAALCTCVDGFTKLESRASTKAIIRGVKIFLIAGCVDVGLIKFHHKTFIIVLAARDFIACTTKRNECFKQG